MANIARRIVLSGVGMVAIGMAIPAFSIEIGDVTLPLLGENGATHAFEERHHVTPDGRRYRIFLATPKAPPPASGYPILYMLDGNAAFAALTIAQLAAVPGLVVAAIGYEGDKAFDVNARSRDYTPPLPGQSAPRPDPQRPTRLVGGAPSFLETLVGPLRTEVEAGLEVDATRRTLWGHSYGGLFAVYTLLTHPETFSAFVPVSPSLWWSDSPVARFEANAVQLTGTRARVLVMLGDRESRSGQPRLAAPLPAPATMALIERLAARDDLDVSSEVFGNTQHGQTLALSLPHVLGLAAR